MPTYRSGIRHVVDCGILYNQNLYGGQSHNHVDNNTHPGWIEALVWFCWNNPLSKYNIPNPSTPTNLREELYDYVKDSGMIEMYQHRLKPTSNWGTSPFTGTNPPLNTIYNATSAQYGCGLKKLWQSMQLRKKYDSTKTQGPNAAGGGTGTWKQYNVEMLKMVHMPVAAGVYGIKYIRTNNGSGQWGGRSTGDYDGEKLVKTNNKISIGSTISPPYA